MDDAVVAAGQGVIVSIRGSVVDMRFAGRLPPIHTLLRTGPDDRIAIEVLAHRDAHHVQGIALTPTQGLARGMAVIDSGGPLMAPVGMATLSHMFDVFGNAIDREPLAPDAPGARCMASHRPWHGAPPNSQVYETGIKAIDVLIAAGTGRQGRAVRRSRRGEDGPAHRADPQHDRAPPGGQHLLRHRRALPRGRGALSRDEAGRRAAQHGDGLRPNERAAR